MILPGRAAAGLVLAGNVCDAVGGLYLAYDVFRRHAGVLGVVTRGATYSVVLAVPAWLALGPGFGAVAGFGLGFLVALDYWLLARHQRLQRRSPLTQSWWAGAARGVVLGLAVVPRFGERFGLLLMAAESCLLALVYAAGFVPTYRFSTGRFAWSRSALRGAVLRAAAMGAAAGGAAAIAWGASAAERFGPLVAALVGLSSVFLLLIVPYVEFWTEKAPDAFFIYAGLALLFCGLACDSIPSLLVLLSSGPKVP